MSTVPKLKVETARLILLPSLLCAFLGFLLSASTDHHPAHAFSSGPPPGYTRAPGEEPEACAECHVTSAAGTGQISIEAPSSYLPNQTYPITVRHTNADPTRLRWGFQLTVLDGSDEKAGNLQSANAFTQILNNAGPGNARQYIEHTAAGTFPGQQGGASWTFNWTSPASDVGTVLFYAAGNHANNDGNSSGDHIYFTFVASASAGSAIQFDLAQTSVGEGAGSASIVVNRIGDSSASTAVSYTTEDSAGVANCNVPGTSNASSRCDYGTIAGSLQFAAGETSKTFSIPLIDDAYAEGAENFTVTLNSPVGSSLGSPSKVTVTINDNEVVNGANPIEQSDFFVRQQYLDFLNREPDPPAFGFWTNDIALCGANQACIEAKRINVSAAFFLSIEFQETGYLVYRMYKAAYANLAVPASAPLQLSEFLPDTQRIGQGVVVGSGNWQALLESNKQAFTVEFVSRPRFIGAFPTAMTPGEFVDLLFAKAAVAPTTTERNAALNEFGGALNSADVGARARVVRLVAENATLKSQEFNRAFVLMQYFGYLRRNPYDPPEPTLDFAGYKFWLDKLNQFNGNYLSAEMVKAFITSTEYRQRFGP